MICDSSARRGTCMCWSALSQTGGKAESQAEVWAKDFSVQTSEDLQVSGCESGGQDELARRRLRSDQT